tara:strand:- start:923 stop:1078 length:156 start_codon:yes stop_codon:yes gene_type:complete
MGKVFISSESGHLSTTEKTRRTDFEEDEELIKRTRSDKRLLRHYQNYGVKN